MRTSDMIQIIKNIRYNSEEHNLNSAECYALSEALEKIKISLIVEYGYEEGMKIYNKEKMEVSDGEESL